MRTCWRSCCHGRVPVKVSACITINHREPDVLDAVFSSMREQALDEFIIVLDAPPDKTLEFCNHYDWRGCGFEVKKVPIMRAPGWRSPVKAWNRGFAAVTGDALYAFSSETVQASGNVSRAAAMLQESPACIFGKATCSCGPGGSEVNWGGSAPGNLLCDAAHPRPLGFIWAAPMQQVKAAGPWDEEFDKGFWHDEQDMMYRLWNTGMPFVFTDEISGVHLHHDRPDLTQDGIKRNTDYMLKKYGSLNPLAGVQKIASYAPGRTTWRHLRHRS